MLDLKSMLFNIYQFGIHLILEAKFLNANSYSHVSVNDVEILFTILKIYTKSDKMFQLMI